MNIKKKISFFALFLISSFFIVGEVKGAYYRYGETGGMGLYSTATSGLESTLTSSYYAYRFTFVKSDGSIVDGTKPVDIYFTGNPINYGTYYKTYKFSDKTYDISTKIVNINKCSTDRYPDECYMSNIISYYKNNTSSFKSQLLGLTGNKKFDDGEFLVVEKLYTINVKTATLKPISRGTACDAKNKELAKDLGLNCNLQNANWSQPVAYEFDNIQNNYYTGTGLNLLNFLKDIDSGQKSGKLGKNDLYYFGMWTDRNNDNGTAGLYFVKNNTILNSFSGDLKVNSEIDKFKKIGANTAPDFSWTANKNTLNSNIDKALSKNRGYGINIFTYEDFEDPKCTYDNHTVFDGGRNWNKATNQCCDKGTYYRGIAYKNSAGKAVYEGLCCKNKNEIYDSVKKACVPQTSCIKDNHVQLNRDWNSKKNVCCDVGELFNGTDCTTKKATQSVGNTVTYKFTTYPSINECMNGTLNSVLSNLDVGNSSARVETSGTNFNAKEADLVIYNSKYKVANKTDIYCKETLTTYFDDVKNNFNDLFSGVYVPIKKQPTLSKRISCYLVDPNAGTKDSRANEGASFVTNQSSNINVILYFMNGYKGSNYTSKGSKYSFINPSIKTESVSVTDGRTTYGVKYTLVEASLKYTFSELNIGDRNKYISISTAKNTNLINDSKKYKTIDTSSIGVPTSAVSGHYNNTIYLNRLDGLLNKMNASYSTNKTLTTDSDTGYCKLNYQMYSGISDCSFKYRELINKGENNTIGYSGKWDGGWCSFEILYSFQQSYCEKLVNSMSNIDGYSVKYISSKDKTVLNFVNNKSSATATAAACHFDIEIKDYELVFRPISLSNPFPGSNGKGRTPNPKVWDTDKIDTYIKNRQDTYTKKPLYSVTLTPSQIQNIREYNRTYKYDNFDLKCVGSKTGTACYSSFIRTYLNTNKSICANTNDQSEKSFNSCADYSKRT